MHTVPGEGLASVGDATGRDGYGVGLAVGPDGLGVDVTTGAGAVVAPPWMGAEVAAGPGVGEPVLPGLPACGDGLAVLDGRVAAGAGDVPEGHLLQVAAQYPPAGAPAVNMKPSLHLP